MKLRYRRSARHGDTPADRVNLSAGYNDPYTEQEYVDAADK